MEGLKAAARRGGLRSASSARERRHSTAAGGVAGPEETRNPLAPLSDIDEPNKITELSLQLQEQSEKVSSLEALLSEKKFLQRHYEALEGRVRRYDEQLGLLAAVLGPPPPTVPTENTRAKLPREKAVGASGTYRDLTVTMQVIMDGAHQLRYEKQCMESELAKERQALEATQKELQHLRADYSRVKSLTPKPEENSSDTINTSIIIADHSTSTKAADTKAVEAVGSRMAEMQEMCSSTQVKLVNSQKELRITRQKLRKVEIEMLESRRRRREETTAATQRCGERVVATDWKEMKNLISTRHRYYFHGTGWVQLQQEKPEAVRCAFLRDASLELHAPYGFITVVGVQSVSDIIALDVDVQRPASITEEQVELKLMDCPFASMQQLLLCKDDPKEGWDLVQEQLREAREELTSKKEEVVILQNRLHQVKLSLEQQLERREADNSLANQALNETEETLKMMLKEFEAQKERERQLREQLRDVTKKLNQQEELAAKQLEEARCKASIELNDAEARQQKEMKEVLHKQQQQQLIKAAAVSPLFTYTVEESWCDGKNAVEESFVESLDPNVVDILGTLLLGEAAVVARAVPVKVLSFSCTTQKLRAELKLRLHPPSSDSACVAESMRNFHAPVVTHFLREWHRMQKLLGGRNQEMERLTKELNKFRGEAKGLELQLREKLHLTEMLAASKQDLEKATKDLETMRVGNQEVLRELQALRRHKRQEKPQQPQLNVELKQGISCDLERDISENVNGDVFTALRCAYEEFDKLFDEYEIARQRWCVAEKSFQKRLRERDVECEGLRIELATLRGEMQEKERDAADVVSSQRQTETERDELLNRIQRETQELARRLAKNDALRREAEAAKKSLEVRLSKLTQQCESLEEVREKFQDLSLRHEKEVADLQNKLVDLQNEMAGRSLRAEELMQLLVREENIHQELEVELKTLRRTKGSSSAEAPSAPEVLRLRAYCQQVLQMPLTEKERTLVDIVSFMEQHRGNAVEGREQLAAALLSMNTAVQLLKQCATIAEEFKGGTIGKGLVPAAIVDQLRNFGRSLSYNGGIPPPSLSTRSSRISGRTSTPATAAEAPNAQSQLQASLNAKPSTLASRAAEVVHFVRTLVTTLACRRDGERHSTEQPDLPSKKSGAQQPLATVQEKGWQRKQRKSGNATEVASVQQDDSANFLRESRAHAICLVLSVKDHLHDALVALQPLSMAVSKTASSPRRRPDVAFTHDVRIAEECIEYALKRIQQSVGLVFSSVEKREIETERGSNYFLIPTPRNGTPKAGVEVKSLPHPSPLKEKSWQRERYDFKTLVSRNANMTPAQQSPLPRKVRSVSCNLGAGAVRNQNIRPEDHEMIQRALTEARRRGR